MITSLIVSKNTPSATPIVALAPKHYKTWFTKQPVTAQAWLKSNRFKPDAGNFCLMPGPDGSLTQVICLLDEKPNLWSLSHLPAQLPPTVYRLETSMDKKLATELTLGWALGSYQFTRYKKNKKECARLVAPKGCDIPYVNSMATAIFWARDLINIPANDINPVTLAEEAAAFAKRHKGEVSILKGEALLKNNWPAVYAVGKASATPPHLVDLRFARKGAPKVTLVGKGVCFDSGGLDIKSTASMKLMKKDMAGAAVVMALAKTLLETNIPLDLRLLLPMVENAVGARAMRPLDIVKTRKGITVEIGNTDAEGRLILCDALFEADEEKPDLLIDCATLTGAARVALGTDMPAFFTPDDKLADALIKHSRAEHDPLWRLPLWKPYRSMLNTPGADISNDPDSAYGGAITAALYLQEFVSKTTAWLHIDMMAWNLKSRPGRPQGGEVMAARALYALIKERYGK